MMQSIKKRIFLPAIILIAAIAADQIIKFAVKLSMFKHESHRVFDWFYIYFTENNGMAFGMEFGSKLLLTWFRLIAVALFIYYIYRIKDKAFFQTGYLVCISLITAGALGNVIDCVFYGVIFDNPVPPFTATLFPESGGYGAWFHGRVVEHRLLFLQKRIYAMIESFICRRLEMLHLVLMHIV